MRGKRGAAVYFVVLMLWCDVAGLSGCSPRKVDPCDEEPGDSGCIAVQLDGDIGTLSRLWLAERGVWVGYTEIDPGTAFQLPVAVAVALPPFIKGTEFIQVSAYRDQALAGYGEFQVSEFRQGEHRLVTLTLTPLLNTDGGTRD